MAVTDVIMPTKAMKPMARMLIVSEALSFCAVKLCQAILMFSTWAGERIGMWLKYTDLLLWEKTL
jgi:hypothetical protein